ncbi:MAG TPA: GNAT family protein [Jatrophihabitantaceae bacterium]|jgi:RimJ/RimL family protein N-acetyltransferase
MNSALHPDYPLRTDRLVLRPFEPDDAEAIAAYQGLVDVCRYIPYSPRSVADVRQRLDSGAWPSTIAAEGDAITLGVTLAATGSLIGDVMLRWASSEHATGEIGYVLHPAHTGHGYATEAVRALLPLAFDDMGLHRLFARLDARNSASANVCRRLGMRQEAHLRENEWFKGEWTDEIVFALLAHESQAQSSG